MSYLLSCKDCLLKRPILDQIFLGVGKLCLCQARLLRWHVAPLLHNGLLHLPGIGSRPRADLLWHVHALLRGFQLGHQLCHMLARPLRFKTTLFLWGILHYGLNFIVALQWTLVEYARQTKVSYPSSRLSDTFLKPQPAGAQISRGSFVQPVMGVYFFTDFLDTLGIIWSLVNVSLLRTHLQTSRGHFEHSVVVV